MRLATFKGLDNPPHVGIIDGGTMVDLSVWRPGQLHRLGQGFSMLDLIDLGLDALLEIKAAADAGEAPVQTVLRGFDNSRLVAPIRRPRKNVLCLGRNYAEHAAESRRAWQQEAIPPPDYPAVFTKAPTAVIGPFDAIPYDPSISEEIDWEVELAVIIGRSGKNIRAEDAMPYIFGYTVLNDISARDIQKRHGGQYFKGKSLDGSCPIGPWIVTADEIADPDNLDLWTSVNGVEKQRDNTKNMIFDVAHIIEQLSFGMTLEPGDIIATGTPAGVGFARTPPEFLRPGDVVESGVQSIGVMRNVVQAT
jgi:2,4-didehydro-3-deoxy-L-rhamnonate hydrolase